MSQHMPVPALARPPHQHPAPIPPLPALLAAGSKRPAPPPHYDPMPPAKRHCPTLPPLVKLEPLPYHPHTHTHSHSNSYSNSNHSHSHSHSNSNSTISHPHSNPHRPLPLPSLRRDNSPDFDPPMMHGPTLPPPFALDPSTNRPPLSNASVVPQSRSPVPPQHSSASLPSLVVPPHHAPHRSPHTHGLPARTIDVRVHHLAHAQPRPQPRPQPRHHLQAPHPSYSHSPSSSPSPPVPRPLPPQQSRSRLPLAQPPSVAHVSAIHTATQRHTVHHSVPSSLSPPRPTPQQAPHQLQPPIPTQAGVPAMSSAAPQRGSRPHIDKFTKSRAVGQSHRDNEKDHMASLATATAKARGEHILLHTFFPAATEAEEAADAAACGPQPTTYARIRASRPSDLPEDHGFGSDEEAQRAGFVKLSADSALKIGQNYISPEMACVMLEDIYTRRNMVSAPPSAVPAAAGSPTSAGLTPPISCSRPRRRRSSYRVPCTSEQADRIANFAVEIFAPAGKDGVLTKLGALGRLYDRFSDNEHFCNPPSSDEDEMVGFPPGSPTRPDAAEFGSPGRRRRDGAKRCSRCQKLKVSGSGHGRSKCDDGYSISSLVRYPAAPKPDEGTAG